MITVQLPTEPSYWGSEITEQEIGSILDKMESMILKEYSEAPFEIRIERTSTPRWNPVFSADCDDDEAVEEIRQWMEDNWMKAL